MLIKDAMNYIKHDINYYYIDIVDMKIIPNKIFFFAISPEDLIKHEYICITKSDEEILITIRSNKQQLIKEAVFYSRTLNVNNIYLALDMDVDIGALQKLFSLTHCPDSCLKDYGVYGCVKSAKYPINTICVKHPDNTDCEYISNLSNEEWAFLPQRIKRLNKSGILIAMKESELLGYLVSASGIEGYRDICMIFVHKKHRHKKIGSLLINALVDECEKKDEILYYGTASSYESSLLAKSLNIMQIRQPCEIYKLN